MTAAQRRSSAVWLREQLQQQHDVCLQEITRNEKLAEGARGEFARVVYCRRMETYRHWKEVLVRILAGKENDE